MQYSVTALRAKKQPAVVNRHRFEFLVPFSKPNRGAHGRWGHIARI
jgi:hypothetical protein